MNARHHIRRLRTYAREQKGVAAIEFAIIASVLSIALLNSIDFANYFYSYMQVNQAAEMGAQAAFATCSPGPPSQLPATVGSNCPNLGTAVTNSVQSTSLGTNVSQITGSPSEGWYCVNSSGSLQLMVAVAASNEPADCSAAGVQANTPGDYIKIQVTYTWTPIFGNLSVAGSLSHTMTSTSYMRLQ